MYFFRYINGKESNWEKVWGLYESPFPDYERHSYSQHLLSMNENNFYCLGIFDDNNIFIGILFYWKSEEYEYIENLAICSNLRSRGFGKKILEKFIKGKNVILLIDPIKDDVSKKRWNFYKRMGFKFNKCKFIHPAMSEGLKDHRLEVLSYPKYLGEKNIEDFKKFIVHRVNLCK